MKDWRYEDLSTLPDDATPGENGWGYGSDVFGNSGCLVIADNSAPTKVWKLPPAVARIIETTRAHEFERGQASVRDAIRDAIGIK